MLLFKEVLIEVVGCGYELKAVSHKKSGDIDLTPET